MKNAEVQTEDLQHIFRSHRAYIININKIIKSTGNAQGLKLSLKHTDIRLPVSRSYFKKFTEIMSSYN